jgi:ABC-2 type transport system ATP-binding protein
VPLISVRSLTKRYGTVTALDGLSVDIEPGIVGLVGSNGAGKSTLLKILLGLIDATSGHATVFDLDVRTKGTDIRQYVGYMPEHDCLPPDASATDVVAHLALMSGLPRTAARERTAEVLRHVGLYEERYRAIGGYSTGMKQRVKLAQALVHDPRLLLLDEPTNGLDPAGRDEMLELVRRTGQEFGIAVIVASHLLGEIERVCEFLVAIEGGKLLRAAPLGDFTEQTGMLAVEVGDQIEVEEGGQAEIVRSAEVGAAALAERLAEAGLVAVVDGKAVVITMADGRPYDLVRDTVADLGLPLVRMEQRRHRLEDLFRDSPDGAAALAAAADATPPAAPPTPPPGPAS